MRWQSIALFVLCLLWIPAVYFFPCMPHWSYEIASTPFFPWGVGSLLALSKSATIVIPFAVVYLARRLDREFSDGRLSVYRVVAYVATAIIIFGVLAFFSLPAITSALAA